jgi:hypothetical protein
MKKIVTVLAFSVYLVGCLNLDEKVDEAVEQCRTIVDEKIAEVWDDCTKYYEENLEALTESLFDEFDQRLREYEEELMTRLGCTSDPSSDSGWDCVGTLVCE